MAYRAAVLGASGYTGAELLRLLAGHPEVEVVHVTADSNAGAAVGDLYPSLGAAYSGAVYERFEPAALDGLDIVFLALPHGESQKLAPELVDAVPLIVDLAADFRLPQAVYEHWYCEAHANGPISPLIRSTTCAGNLSGHANVPSHLLRSGS